MKQTRLIAQMMNEGIEDLDCLKCAKASMEFLKLLKNLS